MKQCCIKSNTTLHTIADYFKERWVRKLLLFLPCISFSLTTSYRRGKRYPITLIPRILSGCFWLEWWTGLMGCIDGLNSWTGLIDWIVERKIGLILKVFFLCVCSGNRLVKLKTSLERLWVRARGTCPRPPILLMHKLAMVSPLLDNCSHFKSNEKLHRSLFQHVFAP